MSRGGLEATHREGALGIGTNLHQVQVGAVVLPLGSQQTLPGGRREGGSEAEIVKVVPESSSG